MRDDLRLIEPDAAYEREFLAMAQENANADNGTYAQSYRALIPRVHADFARYVRELKNQESGLDLPPGYVPQSTYWLLRSSDNEILGVSRLRHRLTPLLENSGGHIGYDIRATERQKGYGTRLLALTLEQARRIGLERALVTCLVTNVASARIIEKNGGMLQNIVIGHGDREFKRYWIEL